MNVLRRDGRGASIIAFLAVSTTTALVGCNRAEPPPEAPAKPVAEEKPVERAAEPVEETYSFTSTNETVQAEEIGGDTDVAPVRADFNMDGLVDMAVVETGDAEHDEVAIYIRKGHREAKATGEDGDAYYRAGAIRRPKQDRIRGTLTQRHKGYTDLILLVHHADDTTETVHYRNNGSTFELVKDRIKTVRGGSDL